MPDSASSSGGPASAKGSGPSKTAPSPIEERLIAPLSRAFPGFESLTSLRRLSGGASQETYRLEIETRSGPRTLALRRAAGGTDSLEERPGPGLAAEAELFRIARAAGVPEPEVHGLLEPGDGLGEGFFMEWLEGETVGSKILSAPELAKVRPRLAFECGEILARIHGIDPAETGLTRRLSTVSTEAFVRDIWNRYQALDSHQPMIDFTARWLLDHLPDETEPRLVHNDFRNGNLMVSAEGVVAVLDWELAHLGDPVRDLGWICTNSWRFGRQDQTVGGFGPLDELLDGYESVSGKRIEKSHVRFWEVFGSFWWAAMSLSMAVTWRGGIDRTVERPAIARRSSEGQVDCANLIIPGPVEMVSPETPRSSVDTPSVDELLTSVREFLRGEARQGLSGRESFLALVASNALSIAERELSLGPPHRRREWERLEALIEACRLPDERTASPNAAGSDRPPLEHLRARLCQGLRSGEIECDHPGLAEHLRNTAANQLAIDQPSYSGLAVALASSSFRSACSSRPL